MWCWTASLLDNLVTLNTTLLGVAGPQYFVGDEDLRRLAAGLRYRSYLAGTFEWLWSIWWLEVWSGRATYHNYHLLQNGGFLLHKVSIQTIPSLWFFVSGATSVFAVNCSDVLCSAIGGHPQVGALRSLKQLQAPRSVSMVHLVIQLQQRNRIKSGWCS